MEHKLKKLLGGCGELMVANIETFLMQMEWLMDKNTSEKK